MKEGISSQCGHSKLISGISARDNALCDRNLMAKKGVNWATDYSKDTIET